MTVQMARNRYAGAVNGSVAYDLNHPAFYPQEYGRPQEEAAPAQRARPKTRERTRVRAASHAKNRQALAPMALVGYAVAAVLLVFSLIARVQLVTVADETIQLENQLTELQTENKKLQIAYESAFNLTEIEDYAITMLGMQQPRSDQVFYVNGTSADRAEIMIEQTDEMKFADRFDDLLESLSSYFQ